MRWVPAAGVAACLLALGACGDRRTFDERYDETGSKLEERARAIDRNIANELPADDADGNTAG